LYSFTKKIKPNSKVILQRQVCNKISGNLAIKANAILITKGYYNHSNLHHNSKDKMLKNKSVITNPSSSKFSKPKKGKLKISKKSLISEIASIKD
jgi:hypothetical protein